MTDEPIQVRHRMLEAPRKLDRHNLVARLCGVEIYSETADRLQGHATVKHEIGREPVLIIAGREATAEELERGWVLIKADGSIA